MPKSDSWERRHALSDLLFHTGGEIVFSLIADPEFAPAAGIVFSFYPAMVNNVFQYIGAFKEGESAMLGIGGDITAMLPVVA